ncbi:longitudinals lacking protein, isoforms H/M/V-like [Dermacentor silvarum]|uniref:longitudinals lacking protein, isoforms H/M/V-like n=1 Tax=Dermacentor silvarum TaxID=543639 RepID=UPI00189A00B3|nr:longitudinals lacking protein, isoforms H/M/V-like [Dermacentor silvarum]
MGSQQFCLKWKSHYSNLLSALDQLLFSESLTDVTLACEGFSLKAHKAVLSACSPFFQTLFAENSCQHPIVILKDFKFSELRAIVDFMYHGEVNVSREQLSSLLRAAEALQVKGLTDLTSDTPELAEQLPSLTSSEVRASNVDSASVASPSKRALKSPPSSKRKRVRPRHVAPREQESRVSSNDEAEEENSSDGEISPKRNSEAVALQRTTRSSKSGSSCSVLETLLSTKELSGNCEQRHRLHACHEATEEEKDFETSRLLEQALAKGDESSSSAVDSNCHEKMFPASSQLSLLATAKMLESGSGKPEAEEDASALLATLAASGESSNSGNSSGQGTPHSLFPARGGRNSGWTEEQMQRALSAVFAEGVPMTAAARRFGIPKTTLLYRLQNSLTRRSPKT